METDVRESLILPQELCEISKNLKSFQKEYCNDRKSEIKYFTV